MRQHPTNLHDYELLKAIWGCSGMFGGYLGKLLGGKHKGKLQETKH